MRQILVIGFALPLFMIPCGSKAQSPHSHEHHHHSEAPPEKPLDDQSIYNLDGQWKNQDGKTTKLASLRGSVRVVAMVFTSCQYACPLITADMQRIEGALSEKVRAQVKFNLFSFDPQRDKPAALKSYAAKHHLASPRWELFTAGDGSVRDLAAVLGVKFKKVEGGDFTHSNVISVIDQDGLIKYQQVGLNVDPSELTKVVNGLLSH